MQRTITGDAGAGHESYTPSVIYMGANNQTINVDREVATLLG